MNRIKTYRIIVEAVFSTLFALLLSSCIDEVQIDRDFDETQKLVLYSRLCPQLDTTYILLTNTRKRCGGAFRRWKSLGAGDVLAGEEAFFPHEAGVSG